MSEPELDPWAEMDDWIDDNHPELYWGCDDERVKDDVLELLLEAIRKWGNMP